METDRFCIRATEVEHILHETLKPQRVWALRQHEEVADPTWADLYETKEEAREFGGPDAIIHVYDILEVE